MSDRVLITGGCGFIGGHLASRLARKGAALRVLDVRPRAFDFSVEVLEGSILDDDLLKRAVEGVDTVFHMAADPNLWAADKDHFYRVNTLGTRKVLSAAARVGVKRFVHTSSESILMGLKKSPREDGQIDESAASLLSDMPGSYCRSKFLAEKEALKAAGEGMPVIVVNPTLPVGPGDLTPTPPTKMLLGFLNGDYPAYLESALNLVDARDIAQGHIQAAEKGRVGERYILSGANLYMSEILQLLHEISGRAMPQHRTPYWLAYAVSAVSEFIADFITKRPPTAPLTGLRLAQRPMIFDNSKARQELGFSPRSLKQSLEDAYCWFQEAGFLKDSKGSGNAERRGILGTQ